MENFLGRLDQFNEMVTVTNQMPPVTDQMSTTTYKVIQEQVTVGDYVCEDSQDAAIWRPDSTDTFPLISFAHGWHCGGPDIHNYDDLMSGIAASGYVVIGNLSAFDRYCLDESKDQIRTI